VALERGRIFVFDTPFIRVWGEDFDFAVLGFNLIK
jgi:hypothetical protein